MSKQQYRKASGTQCGEILHPCFKSRMLGDCNFGGKNSNKSTAQVMHHLPACLVGSVCSGQSQSLRYATTGLGTTRDRALTWSFILRKLLVSAVPREKRLDLWIRNFCDSPTDVLGWVWEKKNSKSHCSILLCGGWLVVNNKQQAAIKNGSGTQSGEMSLPCFKSRMFDDCNFGDKTTTKVQPNSCATCQLVEWGVTAVGYCNLYAGLLRVWELLGIGL